MSAAAAGRRVAVFVLFAALAAAALAALAPGSPGSPPSAAQLAALEDNMALAARLHPAAALPAPPGPASWCAGCHPAVPHPGTGVGRALLNEHASRMDCLLCHWPATGGPRPAPAWQVASGAAAFLAVLPGEQGSPERLTALRTAAMRGRRCFERGPGCASCHRPGGMTGLVRTGSPSTRVASLERLENYFTLAPGQKWYFPQLQ